MKALYLQVMVRAGILAGVLAAGSGAGWAQAPAGPQPTSAGQDKPASSQNPAAPKQQKPQESGGSIAVAVPAVTLDAVAAAQNGDIMPGMKAENFREKEDGQPETIANYGQTAPRT